ncbi:MAG: sensor histidine kinase [bacterium]|nr:sensor histidine kinase [bacterium]
MGNAITNTIKPDWDETEKARVLTCDFLKTNGFSTEIIDAVSMVIGELLENAIKYGVFQSEDKKITYSINIGRNNIVVEVKNPVGDSEELHLRLLDETIQWIRGYQNPFQAYIERLKEVSVQPLEAKESGLGLARIAYEGQSILDFYVNEENIIAVSAIYQLDDDM